MTSGLIYKVDPETAHRTLVLGAIRARARKQDVVLTQPFLLDHQTAPDWGWSIWLLMAGRGSGKTLAGAAYVDEHARGERCLPGKTSHRIAVVAPSHDDAVDTCVRGESGLLMVNPAIHFTPGSSLQADLTWPNGAEAELFGTFAPEDVERFRGPQHCLVWGDEFAAWRKLDESWDMIEFGLRLGPHPRMVLTTTPKRRPKVRELVAREGQDVAISHARMEDNPHLPEQRKAVLYARYGGTTLGRQELDAELIDDVPGALWRREVIGYRTETRRIVGGEAVPDLARVVVAIDPAVTAGENSDETGIVVAALGADGRGYVLDDLSTRTDPTTWARRAITAYHDHKADRLVAEANNGGDLVATVIRAIDPNVPIELVHASRGKRTRAEPVAALYEQGRVSHVRPHPELEDQMCSYTGAPGEESPDRMDALVWALSQLFDIKADGGGWGSGTTWGGSGKAAETGTWS